MATRVKLTTKGFEPFMEQIVSMGKDLDMITDRALMAGGQVLLDGMRRRAPELTGKLKDSLVIDGPHQDGNFHFILVGMPRSAGADVARYGNAQEYGTSSMAAQPYLRPTLDEDKRKAGAIMKKIFIEELKP